MIKFSLKKIDELKAHIFIDFKGLTTLPMDEDYEVTKQFNPGFYTWEEDGVLLGYMGIVKMNTFIYCSYTKVHNRKIYKKMYHQLKELKKYGLPILTDGTNFDHCKNHVVPYKDTELFEWLI